jgi:hypothetical protein
MRVVAGLQAAPSHGVGSPGASQPPAPTDPGVTVSRRRRLAGGPPKSMEGDHGGVTAAYRRCRSDIASDRAPRGACLSSQASVATVKLHARCFTNSGRLGTRDAEHR